MKQIKLIPEKPFHNYVDIVVADFPSGLQKPHRKRCKVTIEFAQYDVEQIKDPYPNINEAMKYYKQRLYDIVKVHIADDWQCVEGYEDVLSIVRKSVSRYY